jgi:hypothetical protein
MIDSTLLDDIVSQLLDAGDDHEAVNQIDARLREQHPDRANLIFNTAAGRAALIDAFHEGDRITWYQGPLHGDQLGTIVEITPTGPDALTALVNPDGDGPFLRVSLEELTVTEPACPAYARLADGTCSVCDTDAGWLGNNTAVAA